MSHASASAGFSSGERQLPDVHRLRRDNNEGTAPTMFSAVSHSDKSSNKSHLTKGTSDKLSPLFRFLNHGRRRKQLSEDELRKQMIRHCENRKWSRVRRLISKHDFVEPPKPIVEAANSVAAKSSSSDDRQSSNKEIIQGTASRRPSYGSRNGERLSFTGKESAAAAAAIQAAAAAALLEECSSSEECADKLDIVCEENILHDICAHNPPRDVIELLLAAMRHRRGSTCCRDDKGRTPLHVAAATGASSDVIDALVKADPLPATMGDDDDRSPLHLAVKYLAYDERYPEQNKMTANQHDPPKVSMFKKKSSTNNATRPILSKEDAICDTRQIILILKIAMMTYPGKVDFKDEDKTGFAPIDYAIDGAIIDNAILTSLIRRNESQDLCRRSAYRSQQSDKSLMSMSSLAAKFTKHSSTSSKKSSQESLPSHDDDIMYQIEKEEIEARRQRIDRLNQRKPKKRMKNRLFDVFGIEELAVPNQPLVESNEDQQTSSQNISNSEDIKETDESKPADDALQKLPNNRRAHYKRKSNNELSCSMTTLGLIESAGLLEKPSEPVEGHIATKHILTEEEMYMHHLQSYLEDNIDNAIGDLKYCDDLEFLYDDPDEVKVDVQEKQQHEDNQDGRSQKDHGVPFEISVVPLESDDCSELTFVMPDINS